MSAVTVASILHKGKYTDLGAAYAYGIKWVEENGYQITGQLRESYIDGVWNTDNENDWLTEIQIPISK